MNPSDPHRPSRPERRFSRMKPAVKRVKQDPAASAEAALAADAVEEADLDAALLADESRTPADEIDKAVEAPAPVRVEQAAPARKAAPASQAPAPVARTKAEGEARVAKVMARAGVCSRRDAEAWIADGRVAINGEVISSPARNVLPDDTVLVDGYPIDKPQRTRLFLFHKTRGLVTTAKDPEGRPTVFQALPEDLPRLVTIGRLDINTEGLLLLTNDGGLARLLELPATGWIRRYRVRANGQIDQATLDGLAKGITVEGVTYAGIAAKLDRVQGANVWLTMGLTEGKNREIKRVLEHLGLAVTRLIRISFGPFQLGELAEDGVEEVRTRVLRDQLGTALAKQAGLDFEGPTDLPAPASESAGAKKKRKAAEEEAEAPRRQIRRSATADRKGRAVTVERITTVAAREDRTPRGRPRTLRQADRRAASAEGEEGQRRFSPRPEGTSRAPSAGQGERPMRRRTGETGFEGNRPQRADRFDGADSRPARRGADEGRPAGRSGGSRFDGQERNARFGGPERGARFGDRDRTARSSNQDRGSRVGGNRREDRDFGSREGGQERRERFDRPQRSERPQRDDRRPRSDEPREGRPERSRAPGRSEGKSFGSKSFGGKSFGGKSFGGGASRGNASRDGKPGGGAPRGAGGSRDGGGKPSGRGGPNRTGPNRGGPNRGGGGGKPRSRG